MKFNLFRFVTIFFVIILLGNIFLFPSIVFSSEHWLGYSNNPILIPNHQPWLHISNPSILQINNNYIGLIQVNSGSGWRLSSVNSFSETNNWTISSQLAIPLGQWDIEHANPIMIYNHSLNLYQMWYSGFSSNVFSGPNRFKLGYATSLNGINWTKYNNNNNNWVLIGDSGKWDEGGIARGISVLLINGTYHLWYTATNSQNIGSYWRIGHATSSDGINWIKNINNPVIYKTESWEYSNMMFPFVLYEDGKFKMWYGTGNGDSSIRYVYAESLNGSEWTKPSNKNPIYDVSESTNTFDRVALAGHVRIRDSNTYKMWYSGFDGTHWSIGYATTSADPINTITPTPTPLEPIIIVPGMMASWNKEGILEGQANPTTSWNLLPFVKEYDGLIQTLKNLGYEEGKNIFLWPYDWRKSVSSISQKLDEYIQTTVKPINGSSKIHLVGHSLGGLITRNWSQTGNNKDAVHHIVTVASPHKGTIQSYKAWSGGDISQENSFLTLAGRMMIELHRRSFSTPREAIRSTFPAMGDILPVEPYLTRQSDGSLIPISDMQSKNIWLSDLNANVSSVQGIISYIKGIGFSTPNSYTVQTPTWLDQALGNWADGKPTSQQYADGDLAIPSTRSSLGSTAIELSQNHSNTIAATAGISSILQSLEIPAPDAALTAGQETVIQPGLLFLLRSPATLRVQFNGENYEEHEGILFIPNAEPGTYEAIVAGTGTGTFRLAVGQFSQQGQSWKEYIGETTSGKQTRYAVRFDNSNPVEDPAENLTDQQRLLEIDLRLQELSKLTTHPSVTKSRNTIKTAQTALSRKDYALIKKLLEQIVMDLSALRKANLTSPARLFTLTVFDTIIPAYQSILSKKASLFTPLSVNRITTLCTNDAIRLDGVLSNQFNLHSSVPWKVEAYKEALQYKTRAETTSVTETPKKYILLFLTQILFREISSP